MSIDFSKITGLSDSRGVITQITDASGRVLWSALKEIVTGTLILRPSADISIEHSVYPSNSTNAYSLINEEVSDGAATYITSYAGKVAPESRLRLFGEPQHKIKKVTSITIKGVPYNGSSSNTGSNKFRLCFDNEEFESATHSSSKDIDLSLANAVTPINEYIAKNGNLPDIDLVINSTATTNTGGTKFYHTGVTQVYVVLGYEA